MSSSVKVINVDDMLNGKTTTNPSNGFFKSISNNPTNLIRVGGFFIILGAIIGLLINGQADDTSSNQGEIITEDRISENDTLPPIINPKFGTSYSGGGGLDELYEDLDGTDPLKNGKLDATIDIDTDKYSCKFNVKYEGENKKMIECLSGCYNEDENSKFCEGYIYNDQVDGGKTLNTLYDDAGGNENARSGQYNAIINVSSGEYYDKEADTSCGFSVEYVGNNKRSVSCNNTPCKDKCKPYRYKSRNENEHGTKGDTLLDDTYVSRRGVLEDDPCDKCNKDHSTCEDGQCKCEDGWSGENCETRIPSNKDCENDIDCEDEGENICDPNSNTCVACLKDSQCPSSGKCVAKACTPSGASAPADDSSSKNNRFYSFLYVFCGIITLALLYTWSEPKQRSIILFIFGFLFTIFIPLFLDTIDPINYVVNGSILVGVAAIHFVTWRFDLLLGWKRAVGYIILHLIWIGYYIGNIWLINDQFRIKN